MSVFLESNYFSNADLPDCSDFTDSKQDRLFRFVSLPRKFSIATVDLDVKLGTLEIDGGSALVHHSNGKNVDDFHEISLLSVIAISDRLQQVKLLQAEHIFHHVLLKVASVIRLFS